MASKFLMLVMLFSFAKQSFAGSKPSSSVAKPGCQEKCGILKISYPFGIGTNCAANRAMEIYCNKSFNSPKAFLRDEDGNNLEVLNISLEAGTIRINYPVTTDCTNTSNDLASHYVRLAMPLTFSNNENRFTAMGCDNLALLSSASSEDSSQPEAGGCLSRCNPSLKKDNSCFGINCCQTKFPQSMGLIRPSLSNLSISSSRCSKGPRYAFIVDQHWFAKLEDIYIVQTMPMESVPAVLNWKAFGACQTFIESEPITNRTLCGANALCTNQSLCSCKEGYQGNPYLPNGCLDIDECEADPRVKQPNQTPKKLYVYHHKNSPTPPKSPGPALPGSSLEMNKCEHSCTNTPGSYNCSCKHGWLLVDKYKCVELQVIYNTKQVDRRGKRAKEAAMAVTTATLAGVVMVFVTIWLYEVIRQINITRLGRRFFKLNGGLLLQKLSSRQGNTETTILFTSKELEKATDNYNVDRIMGQGGQGGQGTVYKGMLTDGRMVVVKKTTREDKTNLKHFIVEVVILSRINHINVVKLYGCCLETEVPLLVYEFIPNGTLMQYIHEEDEYFPLTWDVRVRLAIEIAGGLCYLHSIPIYHRDIKSTNILLDGKYRAKVVDFGISRAFSIDQTHITAKTQGTSDYLDPEYSKSSQFTDKSDVYSFGVVLVELLTGQKPILAAALDGEERGLVALFLSAMEEDRISDIIDSRIINDGEKEEMEAFANIAYRCLNLNGRERPTMKQVVAELESIKNPLESPTAQQNIEEEVKNGIHEELNALLESDVTSSSMTSTIMHSVADNISNLFCC